MNKLKVTDIINTALYSVIIMVLSFAIGLLGFIPQTMPFFGTLIGIITGPVWMLYLEKVNKKGQYFITCFLFALLFGATGHGIFTVPIFIVVGIIGEIIIKKGKYKSLLYNKFAACFFPVSFIGLWIPLLLSRDTYIATKIVPRYGEDYARIFDLFMPVWAFPLMIIGSMVGMYIGCTIGVKLLNKHFKKAGLI